MASAWELNWQRLPLEGLVNARELGGVPVTGGGQTAWHRFLRSDGLSAATDADLAFLEGYGVSAVLDLRGDREAQMHPDRLPTGAAYLNVPLFEFDISDVRQVRRMQAMGDLRLEFFYDLMYENAEGVRRAFEFVAEAPEGCVLFHCAVGKDRTGVMAAMLMLLAGCDRHDVLGCYVPSRPQLLRSETFRGDWEQAIASGGPYKQFDSDPAVLEHWIDRLEAEHGGIVPYLASCGVSERSMAAVRARLLG